MPKYVVVIERGERNWSAYIPDLPGCVAAGSTRLETERLIRTAAKMHLRQMREDGDPMPRPKSRTELITI